MNSELGNENFFNFYWRDVKMRPLIDLKTAQEVFEQYFKECEKNERGERDYISSLGIARINGTEEWKIVVGLRERLEKPSFLDVEYNGVQINYLLRIGDERLF